jgi:membrane associated rhomboid family serine protease
MPTPLSDIAWILLLLLLCPFPVATDRVVRRVPWVTLTLVTINIVCFLAARHALDTGGAFAVEPFFRFGLIPGHARPFDFVTYLFIHQNVLHLLWNMGFLWLFGPSVEDAVGTWFFAALYLGGGIAAGLLNTATVMLFAATQPVAYTPLVGASGAVSAVLGVFAVRFYRSRIRIYWGPSAAMGFSKGLWEAPALAGLGLWLAQNLIGAIVSLTDPARTGIAYWAHIGGFVFGIAVAQVADLLGEGKKEYLLREARAAIARGDEQGECEAIHKYRLTLQRRPDDKESRRALADMARRYPEKSSPLRTRLSREYGALIEYCFTHYQPAQAVVWIEETMALDVDWTLAPQSLAALGGYLERRGNTSAASRIYERLIADYPASPEAGPAYLELASLQLNLMDRPAEAIGILREYLRRAKQGGARVPKQT